MKPIILIGLGASLLFLSGSKKTSSKSTDTTKEPSSKLPGSSSGSLKTNTQPSSGNVVNCGNFEIKQNDKCVSFWNDSIKKKITDKILTKANDFMSNPVIGSPLLKEGVIGKDYIPVLCLKINPTTINPNARQIIIDSILETWGDIKKSDLPPTSGSKMWIKIIWDEVIKIYTKEICQGKSLLE